MVDIARPKSAARNRRLRQILYVTGGICLIALVTFGVTRLKPAAPGVELGTLYTDTVKRGQMLRQVRGPGTLIPEVVRVIAAPVEGRVERIHVQPGEQVTAGTVLVELSNPELRQAEVDVDYQVKAAEAELSNIRVRLESERMSQQAATATIQSEYNVAKLQLDTDEMLAKEGLIPGLTLRLARVRVEELANRYRIEQQRLAIRQQATTAQLAAQSARIEQLRALSRLNRSQVASLRVLAGTNGVLQQVSVEVGQQIVPGANIARVADPTTLKAELQIPETQAKDIQLGQFAEVDTRNGIAEGRVQRIDPAVRNGTVTVDVALVGSLPQGARPDLSVDGTIELERLDNVLHVRRPTFGQPQSTVGLFRVGEGRRSAERVQVKLGRISVSTVEILEGLREGDEVILSDTSQWDNFDRLQLN
ncbi:MAG TPA: HlyD family efflux transporter periplasmic adaptor subunit [Pyrinomonadaceae bacterium]|nr:HlyD family efflux transporter periplasmic adaptor subunit [Pyrinomonadaceae bacterium]